MIPFQAHVPFADQRRSLRPRTIAKLRYRPRQADPPCVWIVFHRTILTKDGGSYLRLRHSALALNVRSVFPYCGADSPATITDGHLKRSSHPIGQSATEQHSHLTSRLSFCFMAFLRSVARRASGSSPPAKQTGTPRSRDGWLFMHLQSATNGFLFAVVLASHGARH